LDVKVLSPIFVLHVEKRMARKDKAEKADTKKKGKKSEAAEEKKSKRGKKAETEKESKRSKKSKDDDEPKKVKKSKKEKDDEPKKGKKSKDDEKPKKEKKSKKSKDEDEEPKKKKGKKSKDADDEPKKGKKSKKAKDEESSDDDDDADDEPKGKKKKGKKGDDDVGSEIEFFNPMAHIDDELDGIEKDYQLSGTSLGQVEDRLSTGNLQLDLILGSGLVPGWYTFFGGEQSCKSTGASTFMTAALLTEVPVISYWDYEGSSSPEYIENIMRTNGIKMPIEQVFGVRDPKTSKWAVPPRVRYYAEGVAEKFFDYVAKLERTLPDKILMGEQWYYVYDHYQPDGKVNKNNVKIVGDKFDKNYFKKTGKYRVPAKDGNLQALVILDSLPAMLPEKQDVDDPGSAMAMQARMFSEQIKRIKGKLRAKRICIVAVNQLRKAPMVTYGNPEYEPCGEAPKFYSDVRLRMQPRVLNSAPGVTDKGMIVEEKSVGKSGGVDKYRMIHVRAHKNKLSVPNLEGWLRLWIEDGDGKARGFDPVWDTWRYLADTGQCAGKRNSIKLIIKGKEAKKAISWLEFKMLIVGSKEQQKKIFEYLGIKPFNLREWCFNDLQKGSGVDKFFATKKAGGAEEEEESKPSDNDDED
jgi:RecA/RadA recombinase